MTPQPSMKRGRQLLNQVSTELGEGQSYVSFLLMSVNILLAGTVAGRA